MNIICFVTTTMSFRIDHRWFGAIEIVRKLLIETDIIERSISIVVVHCLIYNVDLRVHIR